MRLLRAKINNVFSIGEIELALDNRGLTLVTGYSKDESDQNGSGKSSLAHKAIAWGLWGETVIGVKADRVIKRGEKSASVEIDFISIAGDKYSITRTRNPNSLRLFQGEKELTKKLAKETQQVINQLLGRDFKSWMLTDFFGQGRKLAFADLTGAQRYQVLEEILPIDSLQEWITYTKSCIKKLEDELTWWTKEEYSYARALDEVRREVGQLERSYTGWQHAKKTKIRDLQTRIRTCNNLIETYEKDIEYIKKFLTSDTEKDYDKLSKQIDEARDEKYKLTNNLTKALDLKRQWELTYEHLRGDLAKVISYKCYACQKPLSNKEITRLNKRQEDLRKREAEALAHLSQAKIAEAYWKDKLTQQKAIIDGLHARREDVNKRIKANAALRVKISDIEAKIDTKYQEQLHQNLLEAHEDVNPYQDSYTHKKRKLVELEQFIKDCSETKSKLERKIGFLVSWKKIFSEDIRACLLDKVCNFLTTKANSYMHELGNPQIEIQFTTEREQASGEFKKEFYVFVSSATGGEGFSLLSGGEQALTSFAVGLALSDLARTQSHGRCEFMVLDEPFTNLGSTNCERLVQFLQCTLSRSKSTILLISNEDTLKDLIPNKIEVLKHGGTTKLI